jgi:hypothetical protein
MQKIIELKVEETKTVVGGSKLTTEGVAAEKKIPTKFNVLPPKRSRQ